MIINLTLLMAYNYATSENARLKNWKQETDPVLNLKYVVHRPK